jgi:DNA-binding NtrC family response regulator
MFKVLYIDDSNFDIIEFRESLNQKMMKQLSLDTTSDVFGVTAKYISRNVYDVVICDMYFDQITPLEADGLQLLDRIRRYYKDQRLPIPYTVLTTAKPYDGLNKDALNAGIDRFLLKKDTKEQISKIIRDLTIKQNKRLSISKKIVSALKSQKIFFQSNEMKYVFNEIQQACETGATNFIITGDSGTGKTKISKIIYELITHCSTRHLKTLDCREVIGSSSDQFKVMLIGNQSISDNSLSNLYGEFFFNPNIGGFIFDNVQVLTGEHLLVFEKVMGMYCNSRIKKPIILQSENSLDELVLKNKFTASAYYSVSGFFDIKLPALYNRPEDVEVIAINHIKHLNKRSGRLLSISKNTIEQLKMISWRGNIKQLLQELSRMHLKCQTDVITPLDIAEKIRPKCNDENDYIKSMGDMKIKDLQASGNNLNDVLEIIEKYYLKDAAMQCGSSIRNISAAVGVPRSSVKRKLDKYKISFGRIG